MKDNKDKRCMAIVCHAGEFLASSCMNKAKVEFEGNWYCGIHDPVKVAKKLKARQKKWAEEARVASERWRRRTAEELFCQGIPTEYLESNKSESGGRNA